MPELQKRRFPALLQFVPSLKVASQGSNEQNKTQRQTTKNEHDKQHGCGSARLLEAVAMEAH